MADGIRTYLQAYPYTGLPGFSRTELVEAIVLSRRAEVSLEVLNDTTAAIEFVELAIVRTPLERLGSETADRYRELTEFYARAGRSKRAREYWKKWEASVKDGVRAAPPEPALYDRGELARAEGRYDNALQDLRLAKEKNPSCTTCYLWNIGIVFQQMGRPDSAIAYFEQYVRAPKLEPPGHRINTSASHGSTRSAGTAHTP